MASKLRAIGALVLTTVLLIAAAACDTTESSPPPAAGGSQPAASSARVSTSPVQTGARPAVAPPTPVATLRFKALRAGDAAVTFSTAPPRRTEAAFSGQTVGLTGLTQGMYTVSP